MLLEASGIPSTLFDENIVGVHPFYSIAVGGIKLVVDESAIAEANWIIAEYEKQETARETYREIYCPECSSSNVRRNFRGRFSFVILPFILLSFPMFGLTILVLVYFVFALYGKHKCDTCGHAW